MSTTETFKKTNPLGRIFKFSKPEIVLIISLDADYLKIAHGFGLADGGGIRGFSVEPIGRKPESQVAQLIKQYCQKKKISPSQVLFFLPSKQFIFKNVDIPSTDKKEVAKIIDLQAGRFTPYAREEIVIDFVCLESVVQHFTSVLLYIVNRQIVDRFVVILTMAGLKVDKVVVASTSMANVYKNAAKTMPLDGALGGLHIGEDYSELTVIDSNQVVFVRNIPVGANAFFRTPERSQIDFIQELNGSIGAYQDQGIGKPMQKLLVTGAEETLKEIKNFLGKTIQVFSGKVQVSFFDYAPHFNLTGSTKTSLEQRKNVSLFEIFSVLARPEDNTVNLILPEIRLRQRVREASRDVIMLGVLIMAILLLMSLILGSRIYFKKLSNQKIFDISQKYADDAKRLEVISTKNYMIKNLIDKRGKELTVLNVINGYIGGDLYLSQIDYNQDGNVSVSGTAASMSRVFAFVTQLMQSNYFSKVETKETKSRKEGKSDVADFLVECTLAKGF